ncbi:MAG: hypothetical protein JXJ04_14515, partial [Spirochaetales bacterium]|nr:hypothetical protein [Spirochaetales bacterium]
LMFGCGLLRWGITESSTLERLGIAKEKKIIHPASYTDFKNAFDNLWDLRFHRQMSSFTRLSKVDDTVFLSELSREEKKMLQTTRDHIKTLAALLDHDFLGQGI